MPDFYLPINSVRSCFRKFTSIEPLAEGGHKIVYRAMDANGTTFALKILRQDRGPQEERILREISAAALLDAPWFTQIFEARYCQINGVDCIFILEEFIQGQSLASILEVQGAQSLSFIRDVGNTLLTGLVQIEQANLVHRDIKPGNIMIGDDGRIVLIDFGIARHLAEQSVTSSYAFFGPMTVGYCAPEQIQNEKRQISIRTDLFAVGIVIYEMATGRNPFLGGCSSLQEKIERCLRLDPPPLSTFGHPGGLSDFVQICMAKASHRRPASARKALESFNGIKWEG